MIRASCAHSLAPIQLSLTLIAVVHCLSCDQKKEKSLSKKLRELIIPMMATLPQYRNFVLILTYFFGLFQLGLVFDIRVWE